MSFEKNILTDFFWLGKPISECSRDELIDMIKWLAKFRNDYFNNSRAIALGKVEMWKRGERTDAT